jgi:hypothetical protein
LAQQKGPLGREQNTVAGKSNLCEAHGAQGLQRRNQAFEAGMEQGFTTGEAQAGGAKAEGR